MKRIVLHVGCYAGDMWVADFAVNCIVAAVMWSDVWTVTIVLHFAFHILPSAF